MARRDSSFSRDARLRPTPTLVFDELAQPRGAARFARGGLIFSGIVHPASVCRLHNPLLCTMLGIMLSETHNSKTLREYLDSLPRGSIKAFAEACGIGSVYLSQLAARLDGREPSPELCVKFERASGGVVTRRTLRADWRDIWPELAEQQDTNEVA